MKNLLALSAILALTACPAGTDEGTDTDTDDTLECQNGIVEFFPADGATNVYYRTSVEVEFESTDGSESIVLKDSGGADVSTAITWEGNRAIMWPGALNPSDTYTVEVSYECGDPSIGFDTSEVGTATADSLVDRTYELDLASARFVEPAGVGSLIGGLLDGVWILVGISAEDGDTLDMLGALGAEDDDGNLVQEMCEISIELPYSADYSENPYFIVEGDVVPIEVEGYSVEIQDMSISGAFSPDGSYIAGAALAGVIDTRPLGELFGLDDPDNPAATCEFLASLQIPCVDCGDGEGEFCLAIVADSMTGEWLDQVVLEARTEEDIKLDPTCKN